MINNNRWAISVPVARQTAAETLAQKAIAAGIEAEQVDGNDVVAVREAVARALAKARAGGGPHLIEALSYRLGDHTTADDASRYRNDAEVSPHWAEEPIARLRHFLVDRGLWGRADEERQLAEISAVIDQAAAAYLATPPQPPETIFDFTYASAARGSRRAAPGGARRRAEVRPPCPRSRWFRPSTWRSPAPWPRMRRSSSSARTSPPRAACSAPPRGC